VIYYDTARSAPGWQGLWDWTRAESDVSDVVRDSVRDGGPRDHGVSIPVHMSESEGMKKPSPSIFLAACEP